MRILKCQTCHNTWIYTGDLPDACICSLCRTTVRYGRTQVEIRWDHDLDAAPPEGNTAVPFIDVYDRQISIAFRVASEDGAHTRTILVHPRIQSDLEISTHDLASALPEVQGGALRSGRYPLSPAIRDRLKDVFVER